MKSPLPIFVLAALALGPELLAQTGATGPTPVGGRGNHPSFSAEVTGYIAGARVNLTLIVSSEYNPFQVDIFDNPNATGTPRATMTAAGTMGTTQGSEEARSVYSFVTDDLALADAINAGNASFETMSVNLSPQQGVIHPIKPKDALVTVNGNVPAGGILTVHEQTGQMTVSLSTFSNVSASFELVEGTPSSPGATVIPLGTGNIIEGYVELTPTETDKLLTSPFFTVARDAQGTQIGLGDYFIRDIHKDILGADPNDGTTTNAIGFLQLVPGDAVVGQLDTSAFPETVTDVTVLEVGTNAPMATTVNFGGGIFVFQPVLLSNSQIQSYEQNQVVVTLVTATGSYAYDIRSAPPHTLIGRGTPGLDGRTALATFGRAPIIDFAFGVGVLGGTPNAFAAMILGFELHDPPTLLTPFGLDDAIFVKLGVVLPLQALSSTGRAVFQSSLPNDTTFAGVDLFAQAVVFSGVDGISASNACMATIGPN